MRKKLLVFLLVLIGLASILLPAQALEDCSGLEGTEKGKCLLELEAELRVKIQELQGQQKTLAEAISYLDSRIRLTKTQIEQTENELEILQKEIATLNVKIERLDVDLTDVSKVLISRVGATYKRSRTPPFFVFFSSGGFSDFYGRIKYLQLAQINDRQVLMQLQETRDIHQQQKDLKQKKQEEMTKLQEQLAQQRTALNQQKVSKEELLQQTQNDEQKYQQLLAASRAELEAIQAIIAGKGTETEAGHVKAGDKIASIIQGGSCNSSGTHLHFMVSESGVIKNPFGYLKTIDYINCSGPGGYNECNPGDPFNPTGSWDWPISPPVRFSQGFGDTWAVHNTWVGQIYSFHNGIDINSESSSTVKAIKDGDLFKGSYSGSGGCSLRYVRVHHDEGNVDTYYLHVNFF
jgi:peptidoglycan hydrolase CwlO-like protein